MNVLSIKGTTANLEQIAKVAATTRGFNDIVDPLKMGKNFNFILQNSMVATDVELAIFLHKGLKYRHETQVKGNKATRQIGNVSVRRPSLAPLFSYSLLERECNYV